jgi:four helix bundle protein
VAPDSEKLFAYHKALDSADQVCTRTERFQRGYGFLIDQLNGASLSIAANIAERNGRFTKADRRNSSGIARSSVRECVPLLEFANRPQLLSSEVHTRFKERFEEIARMPSGLTKGLENWDV